MADKTSNYNLTKPLGSENYDIGVQNANMDIIDVELKALEDEKAPNSHASTATTYGVSSATNYGHAMASSTTPKANGSAAVGSETAKFARGDHVHPLQTTITGNAGSATKLQTARTIALSEGATGTATSFDGTADITIPVTAIDPAKVSQSESYRFVTDDEKVAWNGKASTDTASTTKNGLMSATDKEKLDGLKSPSSGTGISVGDDGSINHSNSVTAKTTYVGSATAIPRIQYDAQGHITACTTTTVYPPTSAGSSGQVWVSDGAGAGAWKTLITISTAEPTSSDGSDGDLWFVYE